MADTAPNNVAPKTLTPKALVVMGVSSSGKSSIGKALADRLGWRFADGDDFHPPANVEKQRAGQPLTDEDRWPWLQSIADEIDHVTADGGRLVVACSALKRVYRDLLLHGRHDIRIVYLDGARELIAKRMAARKNHFMPPSLLDSQFRTLEIPGPDERPITVSIDDNIDGIVDVITKQLPA
ncbi:gluconokinase [Tardiphaga sp.]|uniref:gluconokinase n=1 Tax=Tardiphaga sp. TaxID=1926292 RepID=UPI00352A4853